MEDNVNGTATGAPEISNVVRENYMFEDVSKQEHSTFNPGRPKQSHIGLSWRTRLVGAAGAVPTPPYEPIQDQETHFTPLDENQMQSLRFDFQPHSQLWRLLFKGFIRWLVTVALAAALGGTMYYYSTYVKPMKVSDKQKYNFLVVGTSLALGMNLASSLKAMATDLRWWVLSLRKRKLREVDLILHMDSLTEVCKLAFAAPRLAPACFAWLLLNLLLQVAVAMIGLCYSPDSVTDTALVTNGTVLIPDMSQIYTELQSFTAKSNTTADQQYTANNFGNIALSYNIGTSDNLPVPDTLWSSESSVIFPGSDSTYWEYIFMDWNAEAAEDDTSSLPTPRIFTNRSVNSTWSCNSWLVTDGGNGTVSNITILLDSNGEFEYITIPYTGGSDQTTFITDPSKSDCGPGCSIVHAFEASETKPWWYECNVTISNTGNATISKHEIAQRLSKMAAAGIALQGHVTTGEQYQSYPATSYYGEPNGGDEDAMGSNIAVFAIGVIATAADWNPTLKVVGNQPQTGSQLEVHWDYMSIIFGVTVGIQLIMFVLSSIVANMVIVKDDSHLATARLLRPIVDRLGPVGTCADGKALCRILDDQGHEKVVYSVKHPQKGILHHLDLGHQKRLRAFPRGEYD